MFVEKGGIFSNQWEEKGENGNFLGKDLTLYEFFLLKEAESAYPCVIFTGNPNHLLQFGM